MPLVGSSVLDMAKERIIELENASMRTSKTEKKKNTEQKF